MLDKIKTFFNSWSKKEEEVDINYIINTIKSKRDNHNFRYFIGNGNRMLLGVAGLLGYKTFPIVRLGKKYDELWKAVYIMTLLTCDDGGDSEKIECGKILKRLYNVNVRPLDLDSVMKLLPEVGDIIERWAAQETSDVIETKIFREDVMWWLNSTHD